MSRERGRRMKKAKRQIGKLKLAVLGLTLALGIGIFGDAFSMEVRADSQARVTASSAKIRRAATVDSDMIGGAQRNETLTVISQVQGSDGHTWYQIKYNDITGYVRSDLVAISDGSTPPAGGGEGGTPATSVEVTPINPVGALVSEEVGRVRSEASVAGTILAELPNGSAVTVTGQVTDSDGKIWYQVTYTSGEASGQGFIRSDYLTLSGDPTGEPGDPEEPAEPDPPAETKKYETTEREDGWYVVDTDTNQGYSIPQLLELNNNAATNNELFEKNEKIIKQQKILIIIMVFLLVAAVAGIAFLVYKIKDMMDSAYYNEMGNEALRKREKAKAANQGGQRVMHTVGTDRQTARSEGGRAAGTRPAGTGARSAGISQGARSAGASQGQRPTGTGTRPAGASQGQRPTGTGTRPAGASQGQRPTGTGTRPAGAPQGARPAGVSQGQRPAGAAQGQRPMGTNQGQRPSGSSQGGRPTETQSQRQMGASQRPAQGERPAQTSQNGRRAQPRNFMVDDDEFEYEYLNYDGDDRRN